MSYTKDNIYLQINATRDIYINQKSKKKLLRDKLSSDKNKTKTLYKITKILTSDTSENNFPESTSNKELEDTFADFFVDKVTKIKSGFQNNENFNIPTRTCTSLSHFQTITQEELTKTIKTKEKHYLSK